MHRRQPLMIDWQRLRRTRLFDLASDPTERTAPEPTPATDCGTPRRAGLRGPQDQVLA